MSKTQLTKKNRPPLIVHEQLVLHWSHPSMAKEVFALVDRNRAHLRPWLIWVDGTKEEEDSFRFLREAALYNEGGQRLSSFIFYKKKAVGSIGFVRINKLDKVGEIGYWLSADCQGKGIMTDACRAMIQCGFQELGLNRIVIRTAAGNVKSQAIPRRLGFRHEGTHRQALLLYDTFHDVEFFALLKEEFDDGESV